MARVEKVLQGSISACAEPYIKEYDNMKVSWEVEGGGDGKGYVDRYLSGEKENLYCTRLYLCTLYLCIVLCSGWGDDPSSCYTRGPDGKQPELKLFQHPAQCLV